MLVGVAVIVDADASGSPILNSTLALPPIATALSAPVIKAVPAVVEDVRVAE